MGTRPTAPIGWENRDLAADKVHLGSERGLLRQCYPRRDSRAVAYHRRCLREALLRRLDRLAPQESHNETGSQTALRTMQKGTLEALETTEAAVEDLARITD
jgi:hypothetical protein